MKVETTVVGATIPDIAAAAKRVEAAGYDSVVTPEAGHDPFLPLMTIAEHTRNCASAPASRSRSRAARSSRRRSPGTCSGSRAGASCWAWARR